MPLLLVKIMGGRPPEKVEALIGALTEATARTLEAPVETIRVLIEEVPLTHWGFAGKSAQILFKGAGVKQPASSS